MNNRIFELAKQSGLVLAGDWGIKRWEGSRSESISDKDLEGFAELIVRECAQVCRNQPNVYALKADRDNCAIAIEDHFGVEE